MHSAAGGIGQLAVQVARLLGAGKVIATASSAAKLDFAKEYGADHGVDYQQEDWTDRVREVAPNGVDVILDAVGGDMTRQSLEVLAPLGRLVCYGGASGELPTIGGRELLQVRTFSAFSLLAWRAARPKEARQDVIDVAEYAATGRLRTSVHATFGLAEASKAHEVMAERGHLGRVLIVP